MQKSALAGRRMDRDTRPALPQDYLRGIPIPAQSAGVATRAAGKMAAKRLPLPGVLVISSRA